MQNEVIQKKYFIHVLACLKVISKLQILFRNLCTEVHSFKMIKLAIKPIYVNLMENSLTILKKIKSSSVVLGIIDLNYLLIF